MILIIQLKTEKNLVISVNLQHITLQKHKLITYFKKIEIIMGYLFIVNKTNCYQIIKIMYLQLPEYYYALNIFN